MTKTMVMVRPRAITFTCSAAALYFILLASRTAAETTDYPDSTMDYNSTASSLDSPYCTEQFLCIKGVCLKQSGEPFCECQDYFEGDACQFVELFTATLDVGVTSLKISWATPVNLEGFLSISYSGSTPQGANITKGLRISSPIRGPQNDTYIIGGLQGDGSNNRVCFVHELFINDTYQDIESTGHRAEIWLHCIRVVTGFDSSLEVFTFVAFGIGLSLGAFVFVIMICRSDSNRMSSEKDTRHNQAQEKVRQKIRTTISGEMIKRAISRSKLEGVDNLAMVTDEESDIERGTPVPSGV